MDEREILRRLIRSARSAMNMMTFLETSPQCADSKDAIRAEIASAIDRFEEYVEVAAQLFDLETLPTPSRDDEN